MTSFQITLPPNRRAAARFIGQVRRALQKAYVEEQQQRGLSQSEIARLLKIHRSVINRELKGLKDMTLGRVGELAWAMGRHPNFSAERPVQQPVGTNISASVKAVSNIPAAPSPPTTSRGAIPNPQMAITAG